MIILLFLLSCERIVLKRGDKAPYRIRSGSYSINMYSLSYPKSIEDREFFLKKLESTLSKFVIDKKRYMLALNESFAKDLINIGQYGLMVDEMFLLKTASQLSDNEKIKLIECVNEDSKDYRDQELLNFQVKRLLSMLGRDEEYEENRVYTELKKNEIIDIIAKKRRRIFTIFKNHLIDLVIELDNSYEEETDDDFEYKKYYYTKEIKRGKKSPFSSNLSRYSDIGYILLNNLEDYDIEKLILSEVKIDLAEYFILNEKYSGYLIKGSIIYFIGGSREIRENFEYRILINLVPTEVEDLEDQKETLTVRTLYKRS